MTYDLSAFKKTLTHKTEWLLQELHGVRTGRATPALLDGIKFEMYGSLTALSHTGTIAIQDARTLYITPWDSTQIKPIEKAITVADLGVSVGSDEKGVRVSFPELTSERREQLIKIVRAKLEEARIAVRGERTKTLSEIEKSGASEDETKRLKVEVQEMVDDVNGELEKIAEKKEEDLKN